MKPLTKLARQIVSAATIPDPRARGVPRRQEERPGPVLLELPEDIAARGGGGRTMVPPHPIEMPVAHPHGDRARRRDDRRGQAAADDARRRRVPAALDRATSAASCCAPAFRSSRRRWARARSPGGTELYMGTAALSERDYVHEAIEQADLIITIGHDTIEKPPFLMGRGRPAGASTSATRRPTVEQVYFPQAEVVGDIGPTPQAAGGPARGPAAECGRAAAAARAHPRPHRRPRRRGPLP